MKSRNKKQLRPRKVNNPVVLVVLDGWGISEPGETNAISLAKTPNFDTLKKEFGSVSICASGECVGLTRGQMGNSEVGHLTIGAGRVVFQDLMRVYDEISSGRLAKNRTLVNSLQLARKRGSTVHLLGLLSDGGVHSHYDHLLALLKIAENSGINRIMVHVFLDGRDTPPKSGYAFLTRLEEYVKNRPEVKVGTISGRYYAMDRDNRWDRTKMTYDAITFGEGEKFDDPIKAVEKSYYDGVNDEFVVPKAERHYAGISDGDLLIFYNFRPDRARQLTKAISQEARDFDNLFDRNEAKRPRRINFVSMTVYDPKLKNVKALLKREHITDTLSNVLERYRVRQLRIAETEKYAHVTYFFNGLVEKPRKFEDRILIPSLRVGTYDKNPEMSAREISEQAVRAIEKKKYGFILINFANADMVGHSGKLDPTIVAVETVDKCLGEIVDAWRKTGNDLSVIITADHGNAEKMFDKKTGQAHTAHTSNPVPLVIMSKNWKVANQGGSYGLKDIAPTVLKIMNIRQPRSMDGSPIVSRIDHD